MASSSSSSKVIMHANRRPKYCVSCGDGQYLPMVYADETPALVGMIGTLSLSDVHARGYTVVDGLVERAGSTYTSLPDPSPYEATTTTTTDDDAGDLLSITSVEAGEILETTSDPSSADLDQRSPSAKSRTTLSSPEPLSPPAGSPDAARSGLMTSRFAIPPSSTSIPAAVAAVAAVPPPVAVPTSGLPPPEMPRPKTHCTQYFHHDGECAFRQTGCRFSHDFPDTWEEISTVIGLNHIPDFFRITRPDEYKILVRKLDGQTVAPWSEKARRDGGAAKHPNPKPQRIEARPRRSQSRRQTPSRSALTAMQLYRGQAREAHPPRFQHAAPARPERDWSRQAGGRREPKQRRLGQSDHFLTGSPPTGLGDTGDMSDSSLIDLDSIVSGAQGRVSGAGPSKARGPASISSVPSALMEPLSPTRVMSDLMASKYATRSPSKASSSAGPSQPAPLSLPDRSRPGQRRPPLAQHFRKESDSARAAEAAAREAKNAAMREAMGLPARGAENALTTKSVAASPKAGQRVLSGPQRLERQIKANNFANDRMAVPSSSQSRSNAPASVQAHSPSPAAPTSAPVAQAVSPPPRQHAAKASKPKRGRKSFKPNRESGAASSPPPTNASTGAGQGVTGVPSATGRPSSTMLDPGLDSHATTSARGKERMVDSLLPRS